MSQPLEQPWAGPSALDQTRRYGPVLVPDQAEESGQLAQLILDAANDAFVSIDEDSRIIEWNRQAEQTFGWSRAEVVGRSALDILIPARKRDAHRKAIAGLIEEGPERVRRHHLEWRLCHRSGHEVPVDVTFWPLYRHGRWTFHGFLRDLSEQRWVEQALQDSWSRYQAIFRGAAFGVALTDVRGRILHTNPKLHQMMGYPAEELRGQFSLHFVHPDDREIDAEMREQLFAGKRDSYRVEKRYVRKDGSVAWVAQTSSLVRGPEGERRYVVGMLEDISERRQAEQEGRKKTIQLLELVAAAASAATSVEEALQICLDQVCAHTGWPVGHALLRCKDESALEPTQFWHTDDPARYAAVRKVSGAS